MAFEGLSEKLQGALKKMTGRGKLTEAAVKEGMREVRMALLEADVNYAVAKMVEAALKTQGAKVIMSRADDAGFGGCIDQRATDPEAGDQADAGQHLAGKPGDARRVCPQPHRGRTEWFASQRLGLAIVFLLFFPWIDIAHDAGLPSVRTMRTRFWFRSTPRRSSAAAKSRSTIM